MRRSAEEELDLFIDSLNKEQEPERVSNPETAELLAVVRAVKSLGRPAAPSPNFGDRVYSAIRGRSRPRWALPSAALAAGLLLLAVITTWTGSFNRDVVYAMEQAVGQLTSYYGILEVRSSNAAGEEWPIRRVEIWSEGEKYAARQGDGTLTVNNNERRWQVRVKDHEVALLPLVPDPTRHGFDLQDEAERARRYPHSVVGRETVAGRPAVKLEISPPGGLLYYLWIDVETNLPLQLQTARQNALQTTYTFVAFEPNTQMDPQVFAYQPPDGYRVVEEDPGQLVATAEEAAEISRITPLVPQVPPSRIFGFQDRIVLDYGDTTIVESAAKGVFEPVADSALGTAAGGPLEVWQERLRWRQNGIEIRVEGPRRVELARQIATDLALPDTSDSLTAAAQIQVPVDIEIARANQRQVDGGHSPWQLDPLQVSLTFVNLKLSPEGISGEPLIAATSFELAANNGTEAVVAVADGPIKTVYLKRLIRQDETGIWSVVGYDPR